MVVSFTSQLGEQLASAAFQFKNKAKTQNKSEELEGCRFQLPKRQAEGIMKSVGLSPQPDIDEFIAQEKEKFPEKNLPPYMNVQVAINDLNVRMMRIISALFEQTEGKHVDVPVDEQDYAWLQITKDFIEEGLDEIRCNGMLHGKQRPEYVDYSFFVPPKSPEEQRASDESWEAIDAMYDTESMQTCLNKDSKKA